MPKRCARIVWGNQTTRSRKGRPAEPAQRVAEQESDTKAREEAEHTVVGPPPDDQTRERDEHRAHDAREEIREGPPHDDRRTAHRERPEPVDDA
jgi:hypothetical protein